MPKLYMSSICLTDLLEAARTAHSACSKSHRNQKIYASCAIWVNDEPDKYGNHLSISLASKKEDAEAGEKKVYIGQGKAYSTKPSANDLPQNDDWMANVPKTVPTAPGSNISSDDMPF